MLSQAVILAGGRGERLSKLYKNTPKCLVKLYGKPILQYQLEILEREKFSEVIILTHHLSEKIEKFISSYNSNSLSIRVIKEDKPLGTAGSLISNLEELQKQFCLVYGDLIFDINFEKFRKFHIAKKSDVSLLLHPNDHPKDSDLVELDEFGKVHRFHKYPHKKGLFHQNLVNAAIYIFNKHSLLEYQEKPKKLDFGKDIFPKMLKDNKDIFGYESPEYIKDAGTPERLKIVKKHINKNFVKLRNLSKKRPCIFIDRDGTINEERGYISKLKDFELLPKVGRAIKLINNSNYLSVLITNQPVLARGGCTFEELRKIHNKMEFKLSENKAYLDRIYLCPHHPDKGFKGEVEELKINCNCRKPKTGLFKKAIKDLNIDLEKSWMIGDSFRDIQAANKLGIKSILLNTNNEKKIDIKYTPTFVEKNLYDAVKKIFDTK
tara:strand:- start:6701 stop:8005 length:1305 start_codon:yes stop_codon:yes gene_type:complete